jgi:shikimate 5-dehydrogenase
MYFIGVTTRQSSINQVFPRWAEELGLGDCALRGLDFPLHADPQSYRAAVKFIKEDPLSLGALVTTHKIDLCAASMDLFDEVDPLSRSLGEISSIYKRAGRLHGRSVDPWTSGYALDAFLPPKHWATGAEVLILGAGGAGSALAWQLCQRALDGERPKKIHAADRAAARLEELGRRYATWPDAVALEFHHVPSAADADKLLARLPPGSLVVNATGAGKDTPGSPLTAAAIFPERGVVWEFNYRGELVFLEQARAQQASRRLLIEDGWKYFLHGWTRVIADVFDRAIPVRGPEFETLGRIAASAR